MGYSVMSSSVSELDLGALLRGNAAVLRAFVIEYSPIFRAVVRRALSGQKWGDREEDLVQDIFLALLESNFKALRMWRADGGCTLKTFLCRFAVYRTVDRLRGQVYGGRLRLLEPSVLARLAGADPMSLSQQESRDALESLLLVAEKTLGDGELRFFIASYIEGRPVSELAAEFDTTEQAIHQRRSRVRHSVLLAFHQHLIDGKKP